MRSVKNAGLEPCEVRVRLGEVGTDVQTGEEVFWNLNGSGHSPHFAIMGEVGSGKTRTLIAMVCQIRAVTPVPLLIFDLKGDLRDNPVLRNEFGAQVINVPLEPVPLDVLAVADNLTGRPAA